MTERPTQQWLTPLAIVVAGALIAGSIIWSSAFQVPPQPAGSTSIAAAPEPQPPAPVVDSADVDAEGEPFIGKADAPATIAYWFDYQCPFCRQEEEAVLPQVIKDYVDTGKARIVFKDFQFLGPDSFTAGLASAAIWESAPDKFYEWHKAMFDKQDDENAGWGNKDDIMALVRTIQGIDAARVEELMTSKAAEYEQEMAADSSEGVAMGVSGTPSFVIGKQLIVGAQPFGQLRIAIEAALTGG